MADSVCLISAGVKGESLPIARKALQGAQSVFVPSKSLPFFTRLKKYNPIPLDAFFLQAEDFNQLNRQIAAHVLAAPGRVAYVAEGFALQDEICREIDRQAVSEGIAVVILPGLPLTAAAQAAAGYWGEAFAANANGPLERPDVSRVNLYYGLFSPLQASELATGLSAWYHPEQPCCLYGRRQTVFLPLQSLYSQKYTGGRVLVLPALPLEEAPAKSFAHLEQIMERLLAPGGCPWDREQTHQSLKPNLLEETYEVLDAIDSRQPETLCDELGDLLLQVVFHAALASRTGDFTIDDVTTAVCNKLVERHPHVFGSAQAHTSRDVITNWDAQKRKKKNQTLQESMQALPPTFPALLRGQKLHQKLLRAQPVPTDDALLKTKARLRELAAALPNTPDENTVGELLLEACRYCELHGISAELACRRAGDNLIRN